MRIGMIPTVDVETIKSLGNAASTGASMVPVEIILAENHQTVPVNFIYRAIDPSGIYQSFH